VIPKALSGHEKSPHETGIFQSRAYIRHQGRVRSCVTINSTSRWSCKPKIARIFAAKGGTGIPACASAASQTRLSVSQWERVNRLYGLTPEEIKIVEYASAKATADKGEKWTGR